MPRIQRLAIAMAASLGLASALAIGFVVILFISLIAFSGSTGTAHSQFWNGLAPIGYFAVGAAFGAWIVGIANSVLVQDGVWWGWIAGGALLGGLAAALIPPFGALLVKTATPVLQSAANMLFAR